MVQGREGCGYQGGLNVRCFAKPGGRHRCDTTQLAVVQGSSGVCPAGRAHSSEGSGNYVLPVNSGSGIEEVPYRIYTHLGSAFTLANTQERVFPGFLILTQSKQWTMGGGMARLSFLLLAQERGGARGAART